MVPILYNEKFELNKIKEAIEKMVQFYNKGRERGKKLQN